MLICHRKEKDTPSSLNGSIPLCYSVELWLKRNSSKVPKKDAPSHLFNESPEKYEAFNLWGTTLGKHFSTGQFFWLWYRGNFFLQQFFSSSIFFFFLAKGALFINSYQWEHESRKQPNLYPLRPLHTIIFRQLHHFISLQDYGLAINILGGKCELTTMW